MENSGLKKKETENPIDLTTTLFLVITPLLALIAAPLHILYTGMRWELVALFLAYGALSNLSITAGYHRYLSHLSYEASPWVRKFYLFFGAAAFQGSALKWCADHRRHHRFVDTDRDPYNINRGFFFAHMGWLILKDQEDSTKTFAPDLQKDKWIRWQHQYYVPLAIVSGFGIPTLIGWALGSPFGGFIFGGVLRTVVTQHTTFLINSWCHMIGSRTYGSRNSARDSFIMSVLTHGEGYHNFHHHFQADYRNGIRWFDWDPTKWFIQALAGLRLAGKLKTVCHTEILASQLEEEEKRLLEVGADQSWIASLKERIQRSQTRWLELKAEYRALHTELKVQSRHKLGEMNVHIGELRQTIQKKRREMKLSQIEFRISLKQWRKTQKVLHSTT